MKICKPSFRTVQALGCRQVPNFQVDGPLICFDLSSTVSYFSLKTICGSHVYLLKGKAGALVFGNAALAAPLLNLFKIILLLLAVYLTAMQPHTQTGIRYLLSTFRFFRRTLIYLFIFSLKIR